MSQLKIARYNYNISYKFNGFPSFININDIFTLSQSSDQWADGEWLASGDVGTSGSLISTMTATAALLVIITGGGQVSISLHYHEASDLRSYVNFATIQHCLCIF